MDKGRIEQIGTPAEVYDNPQRVVHGFIGESIVLAGGDRCHEGSVRLARQARSISGGRCHRYIRGFEIVCPPP